MTCLSPHLALPHDLDLSPLPLNLAHAAAALNAGASLAPHLRALLSAAQTSPVRCVPHGIELCTALSSCYKDFVTQQEVGIPTCGA